MADALTLSIKQSLAKTLVEKQWMLVTAESCTGGGVAERLTAVPGSSEWFCGAFVTYSNAMKQLMLGVSPALLERFGAVSAECVDAMVVGAMKRSGAQVAVSISGIAGPTGGSEAKPVGTVWVAWGLEGQVVKNSGYHFLGDRDSVRKQAVKEAIMGLVDLLEAT